MIAKAIERGVPEDRIAQLKSASGNSRPTFRVHFVGRRTLASSVPTTILPVKPLASTISSRTPSTATGIAAATTIRTATTGIAIAAVAAAGPVGGAAAAECAVGATGNANASGSASCGLMTRRQPTGVAVSKVWLGLRQIRFELSRGSTIWFGVADPYEFIDREAECPCLFDQPVSDLRQQIRPPCEVFVPAFAAWPAALRRPATPATLDQPSRPN